MARPAWGPALQLAGWLLSYAIVASKQTLEVGDVTADAGAAWVHGSSADDDCLLSSEEEAVPARWEVLMEIPCCETVLLSWRPSFHLALRSDSSGPASTDWQPFLRL